MMSHLLEIGTVFRFLV
jgi:hypothetical protein